MVFSFNDAKNVGLVDADTYVLELGSIMGVVFSPLSDYQQVARFRIRLPGRTKRRVNTSEPRARRQRSRR